MVRYTQFCVDFIFKRCFEWISTPIMLYKGDEMGRTSVDFFLSYI